MQVFRRNFLVFFCFAGALGMIAGLNPANGAIVADHTAVAQFDSIPEALFQDIRDNYSFFYGHTSHGSQVIIGIEMLVEERGANLASPEFHEVANDLGSGGDLTWVQPTRNWLDTHPETNSVLWSWCGGCSVNTEEDINTYLNAMSQLEVEYPDVSFIYMTGHLDGTGVDGALYRNNNQIRNFCMANDKILYDFADIESWDPAENFYPDETDACGWCAQWCATENCPDCDVCAHSHCFNCYRKAKAFWWMLARVSGWGETGAESRSLGSLKSLFR